MEDFCVGINCSDLQIKISIKMETQNHFFRPDPVGMLNTRGGHLIYIVFVAQDVSDAPKDNQIWISGDIDFKEANFLRWYNVIVFKCAQGSHLILIHNLPITGRVFSISPNSYPNYAIQLKKMPKLLTQYWGLTVTFSSIWWASYHSHSGLLRNHDFTIKGDWLGWLSR